MTKNQSFIHLMLCETISDFTITHTKFEKKNTRYSMKS